ncbi:MAG: alpha/beta hydrolase [bacterium]|nr:alpha/beta hydrolase [bacterium]MDE0415393.1 alpha/beta hydrolase [bacterium]
MTASSRNLLCSGAARKFMAAAPSPPVDDIVPSDVPALRRETLEAFQPRIDRALERFGPSVEDVVHGGVRCLEILPRESRGPGTILYFFGGGYIIGSPEEDLIVSAALASLCGVRVVSPAYRLAPEHPCPAAIDDGMAVHAALARDPRTGPLAIAGESAGGNAALSVLRRLRRDGQAMPVAAALLSPWCDLTHAGDSHRTNDGRDPTLAMALARQAARLYCGGLEPEDPDVSPLWSDWDDTFPPAIITTGTRDLLMSQCVQLAQVLRGVGAPVELRIWDDLWHVFEFYDELPEAERSLGEIAAFLSCHFEDARIRSPS